MAQRRGWEGTVLLRVEVTASGKPGQILFLKKAGQLLAGGGSVQHGAKPLCRPGKAQFAVRMQLYAAKPEHKTGVGLAAGFDRAHKNPPLSGA